MAFADCFRRASVRRASRVPAGVRIEARSAWRSGGCACATAPTRTRHAEPPRHDDAPPDRRRRRRDPRPHL